MDSRKKWIIAAIVAVIAIVAIVVVRARTASDETREEAAEEHHEGEPGNVVELTPEAVKAAGIQIVQVRQRVAITALVATGTIEANQQRMQQVSPLVSGRVDRMFAAPGDRVRAGQPLAILSSPEVAELHGKLLEAQARASLAESNLRRLRKLSELGAAAGKDLAAGESEVTSARAEVEHVRGSLMALGSDERVKGHSISSFVLRAPISGTITERFVNPGSGVQAGNPIFSIADLSTVWVIANVPDSQINVLRVGTPAGVRSAALGQSIASGRITYIDPVLNEETRTARVRIEAVNPNQQLKIGTFVEVSFQAAGSTSETASELVIPEEAIQTVQNRTVVFVPTNEAGHFQIRDVQLGGQANGLRKVIAGLTAGERVVGKGSFVLKTQMLKGELGEHGH